MHKQGSFESKGKEEAVEKRRRLLSEEGSNVVSRFGDARAFWIPRIVNVGFFGGCAGSA